MAKGSIEKVPFKNKWRVWKNHNDNGEHGGYLTNHGGFTKYPDKAQQFDGCGIAIRVAQCNGIAITEY